MNKFLILMAAFLCAYQFANAQTEKGSHTLGLNVGLEHNEYTDNLFDNAGVSSSSSKTKNTNLSLGPLFSYFIADNWDLGALVSLSSYTNSTTYPNVSRVDKNYNKSYDAMIYVRKYFLYANKIGIRTGPYIGYIHAKQGFDYSAGQAANNSGDIGNAYQVGGRLEAVYYPSKHFGVSALLAALNFQHGTNKKTVGQTIDKTTSNSVDFNIINSGLGLSLFYVFGNK